MRRGIFIVMALALAVPAHVHAQPSDGFPGWMAGAWASQNGEEWGDEYWTPPRGGIMIGAARIGKGDRLIVWESTRIAYDEEGKLAFWAMPRGVSASKFPLVSQSDTEIVFANAAHDYPQRIRYWRDGKMLKAEISLIDGGKAYNFSYLPMGQF